MFLWIMYSKRRRVIRAAAFHPEASFSCPRCALYISVVPHTRITAVLAYQKEGITIRGILILRRRENRNRKKEGNHQRGERALVLIRHFLRESPLR